MTVLFFHWGVHAWVCYLVVAILLALVSYRWDMPMTIRSAFYPLIGTPPRHPHTPSHTLSHPLTPSSVPPRATPAPPPIYI